MQQPTSEENKAPLINKFNQLISLIASLEKQLKPIYAKLQKKAFHPELAKCLHPEQTELIQHQSRLTLIRKSLKLSTIKVDVKPIEKLKLRSASQVGDLDIISFVLHAQHLKLGTYEMLHALACSLNLEIESQLLEQSITDNRNTNTWLRELLKNVIAPVNN